MPPNPSARRCPLCVLLAWMIALSVLGCAGKPIDPNVAAEQAWPAADRAGTPGALSAFAERYPGTKRSAEAQARLRVLDRHTAYLQAVQAGTALALEAFLVANPAAEDGRAAYDALQVHFKRSEVERVESEWQQLSASNDLAALQVFAQSHAKSPHLAAAREQVQRLAPDTAYAAHLRAMLALEHEEQSRARKSNSDRPPADVVLGYYATLSAGGQLAIVFKDPKQRYRRLSTWPAMPGQEALDVAVEYPQLRGIEPFEGFILLIDEAHAANAAGWWREVSRLFLDYASARCSALAKLGRGCGTRFRFAPVGPQAYPHGLEGTKVAEFIIDLAHRHPEYNTKTVATTTDVPPRRFEETPLALAHVQRLREVALGGEGSERQAAVVGLLHVPGVRSEQVLSELTLARPAELVAALSDQQNSIQTRAEQVVLLAGPVLVPELVMALEKPPLRLRAIEVLGKIKDPRSVQPLVRQLRIASVALSAAVVLKSMNWEPTSDAERVDQLVAMHNRTELREQWPLASAILFGRLAASRTIDYDSLNALIAIGHPDAIAPLLLLLKNRGDAQLTTYFANCGNEALSSAARDFASERRYIKLFSSSPATAAPSWGRF